MVQTQGAEPAERPLLLVIATGPQRYREYVFASMAARYRIHLLNTAAPTWEQPYLTGWTVVPSTDADVLIIAARDLAAQLPVSGVLSWDEARILQAALVAEDLGLPGTGSQTVLRCRDKHQTRLALAAAGVPQPAFAVVGTVDEALAAAEKIGYPVVLKPRAAAASYGVVLVRDAGELAARFTFADEATVPHAPRYPQAVLVEEYLDAPEISIDSVVFQGRVEPLFVAHKEIGFAPYFEEIGHRVSNADPVLADPDALKVLHDTHAALGFTSGWTHAEFKLTPQGLKVIEVNGRLGGDLIPYLGMLASGIDPSLAAADVACGRKPGTTAQRAKVGGVRFFYPEHDDTVIESVEFDAGTLPPQTDQVVPLAEPGSVVSPPPNGLVSGRIAFATVVADTPQACIQALDQIATTLTVRIAHAGAQR
ncbi:acetyl-CoA carboxylase biotin carboxylase subunit family protein [Nocardia sp. NPDC051570]|uniref:acetyl-CoA carboxylase biotin carboxylase subunit family protein n=1 Tax=Nocardia sp. NPDC051570 TaxID=3364324 RepID=UPI003793F2B4